MFQLGALLSHPDIQMVDPPLLIVLIHMCARPGGSRSGDKMNPIYFKFNLIST